MRHRRGLQRRVLEPLRPRAEARRRRLRGERPAAALLPLQRLRPAAAVRVEQAPGRQDARSSSRTTSTVAFLCNRYAAQLLAAGHLETVGAHVPVQLHRARRADRPSRPPCLRATRSSANEERGVDRRASRSVRSRRGRRVRHLARTRPTATARAGRSRATCSGVYDERPDVAEPLPAISTSTAGTSSSSGSAATAASIAGVPPEFVPPPVVRARAAPRDLPDGRERRRLPARRRRPRQRSRARCSTCCDSPELP